MTLKQSADLYRQSAGDDQYIMVVKPDGSDFAVRKFYFRHSACDSQEMAWATSMQCRFTGHVRRRYSVAEHCLLVADLMCVPHIANRGGTVFEALMHDQHEGYVSDLSSPAKAEVRDFKPFETIVETRMRLQYGLPLIPSEGVKYADWIALFIEAEQLIGRDATRDWLEPEPGVRDFALSLLGTGNYLLACWPAHQAYEMFMRFYGLKRTSPWI